MKFKIYRYNNLKSTNDTAIRIIKSSNINYGMILSNLQSKGRGQYGKKWISLKGNIFITFFYNLENLPSIKKLTKINCFIIKKTLSSYIRKKINFKKPNDLLIGKKKICGILQEKIDTLKKNFLVVGVGINLVKSPNITDYPTTSIYEIVRKKLPKKKIETQLKKDFELKLTSLYKNKNR